MAKLRSTNQCLLVLLSLLNFWSLPFSSALNPLLTLEKSQNCQKCNWEAYIPKIAILRTRKYNFLRREIQCVSVLSVEEVAVLKHNGLVRFPENSRDWAETGFSTLLNTFASPHTQTRGWCWWWSMITDHMHFEKHSSDLDLVYLRKLFINCKKAMSIIWTSLEQCKKASIEKCLKQNAVGLEISEVGVPPMTEPLERERGTWNTELLRWHPAGPKIVFLFYFNLFFFVPCAHAHVNQL